MHPSRAARLTATIGAALLFAVLALRLLSIGYTISAEGLDVDPDAWQALPAVDSYQVINGGTEILFQQTFPGDGKLIMPWKRWFSMPVEGGPITPADAPQPTDWKPFLIEDGRVRLQRSSPPEPVTVSPANETVIETVLSPDGKGLAFTTRLSDQRMRLYVVTTSEASQNSSDLVWIGEEAAYYDLNWSPDGEAIAFIAPRQDVAQVFRVDANGQNYRALTSDPIRKSSPRWSPDGTTIAYLAITTSGGNGTDSQGLEAPTLTPPPDATAPAGETIPSLPYALQTEIILSSAEIYVIGADGQNARRLPGSPSEPFNLAWIGAGADSEVAFTVRILELVQTSYYYAVGREGGEARRVYPPVALEALECPAAFPIETEASPRLTLSNSGRVPIDMPLVLSAQGTMPHFDAAENGAAQRLETITLLPGETHLFEWPVRAVRAALIHPGAASSSGRVTYVSVSADFEEPMPIHNLQCSAPNTYLGLPNLPLLWLALPVLLLGMVLCIPRLLQMKNGLWWALWAAVPLVFLALAVIEANLKVGG